MAEAEEGGGGGGLAGVGHTPPCGPVAGNSGTVAPHRV